MQKIINGEQPFQVLSTNFTIGPSESGYDLYFSADGREYSKLFTVAANTNRQVTQVAAGSYYYLEGNTDTAVTVNWIANCYSGGEGGGGSYVLPVASSDTLGGVKIGSGLTMSGDTLNANPGGYTLPAATDSTLGGVKVGSGLTIDANGVLSVSGGTGGDMTVLKSVSELPNSADTGDVVAAEIKVGTDWVYVGEGYYDTNISSGNPYGAKYVVLGTYADFNNNTIYFGIVWENGQWKFVYDISLPDYGEYVSVLAENSDSVTIETYTGSFDIYFSENDGVYTFDVQSDSDEMTRVAEVVTNPMVFQFNGTSWDKVGDYTLPAASQNTLGGIKVGSGLTIDSGGTLSVSGKQDTLTAGNGIDISGTTVSVKAGEGLGFSGDTLVVSGTSSNTKVVMLNKLSQQECLDLYNELSSLYDYNANGWSSAYTEDMYAFYLDLRSYADQELAQTADRYEGFYPMECCRMHPTDYGGAAFFTGVEQDRQGNGQLICIRFVIDYEGNVDGPSTWWNNPPSDIPSIGPVSFGNDGRGGLTFDADNDQFLYDNGTVATGDTSNYVEDIIDFAYLSSLFNRDGKFDGFRFLINSHVLNVQSNGETHYYAQPSLAKKPITGYTIGDYTFVWEFTFKYIDYVLKIDAPDGTNIGANLRITQA